MPINQADTAWMLVSTALVLLMTPALAFFYGGLVRSKNALNTMMMSFISLGFVGVLWAVIGYSLAFTPGNAWIGDTSRVLLHGVGLEPSPSAVGRQAVQLEARRRPVVEPARALLLVTCSGWLPKHDLLLQTSRGGRAR